MIKHNGIQGMGDTRTPNWPTVIRQTGMVVSLQVLERKYSLGGTEYIFRIKTL